MSESKTSPTTTSRPEDHPEVHPFILIGYDSEIPVLWCPQCGAIVTGVDGYVRLPDIAMEGYREEESKSGKARQTD